MKKPLFIKIAAAVLAAAAVVAVFFFTRPATGAELPTILVPGYSGWGQYDERYEETPYWGLTLTDYRTMFDRWDQDVYIPSLGPSSSAWDRACELYAELTGTRVDYGEAHSRMCGHERFGRDYSEKPLIPDFTWDEDHPVNLVGHSFGGTTSRVLLDLLADGAPEETAATGDETSPLFTGGKAGLVFSLTTIASPSNGTTAMDAIAEAKENGTYEESANFSQSSAYDAYLDQFGIVSDESTTQESASADMKKTGFYEHNDSAVNDMSVDRACAMNAEIELQPNVYYFCYYGCRTEEAGSGAGIPTDRMCKYLRPLGGLIGSYTETTKGSFSVGYGKEKETVKVDPQEINEEWQPNDGMVNTVSAYCPYHLDESGERIYDAHVDYDGSGTVEKGVWNILPEFDMDHYGFIGGIYSEDITEIRQIYKDMHDRLDSLKVKK